MRKVTQIVVAATAVALAAYDLIPAVRRGPGDTISEVVRDTARKHPIVAFALGVLVGHWFWTSVQEKVEENVVEKLESKLNG